jgi:hypothetical protein
MAAMLCVLAATTLAGGGPQNVLVVYNSNAKYAYSKAIAEHYQAARGLHADQLLGLDLDFATLKVNQAIPGQGGVTFNAGGVPDALNAWTVLTVDEFTRRIYNPIVAHLQAKGLEDQVYILVFVKGVPWRLWPNVTHDHPLNDAAHPDELNGVKAQSEGGFATTLARASFGNAFSLTPIATSSAKTDYFATFEAFRPNAFIKQDDATKRLRFLVSLLYGPTVGTDYTSAAFSAIDGAVAADGTRPTGTFAFLSTDNQARNARKGMSGIEAAGLRKLGFGAIQDFVPCAALPQYNPASRPGFVSAVCGVSLSGQTVQSTGNPWAAWTWAAGALGDALTSFSGHYLDSYAARGLSWYHVTPEWWMMAGTIGGYGTGVEPGTVATELATRFVAPLQYRRWVEGFSLAEVTYQSVEDVRFLTLVGDPLAAPYARRPAVTASGLPTTVALGQPVSLTVAAAPHAQARAVRRLELYVDGKFVQSYEPLCPAGQTVSATVGGVNVSYVTQAGDSRGTIIAALADALNARAAGTFTAACQDIAFSAPTADGWPRWNAERRTNQPITDGLLVVSTQATGAAGNGVACAAQATASGGGTVAVHPHWLALQTFGGAEWNTGTAAASCYVQRKVGSTNLVKTGGETLTVTCTASGTTASRTVAVDASWTLTTQVQAAIQSAMVSAAAEAEAGGPGYYIYGTSVIRGLPGAPPETRFAVTHPDHASSGFEIILGTQLESAGHAETLATGGKSNGPGINYLYLDVGPATLSHAFQIDTAGLALGTHEVLVVAVDGGAAEAQGYARGTFTVSAPIGVAATWVDGSNWCYENTPASTCNRHLSLLQISVVHDPNGNSAYQVAVSVSPTTTAVAEATADVMRWKIVGGQHAAEAAGPKGQSAAATVQVTVQGTDRGGTGTTTATLTVRHLGDTNGDGFVNAEDKLALNQRLNGVTSACTLRGADLDADGLVNSLDKLIVNLVLNGLTVP